jgi:hypothetical protein
MPDCYHILNGDALKEQLPGTIKGEIIVMRECLVDGDVTGKDLEDLLNTRATFLSRTYGITAAEYDEKTRTEIQKIREIDPAAAVYLWFEDDFFCQVNCWFVLFLLQEEQKDNPLYLVRPPEHSSYGFGGLSSDELLAAFEYKQTILELGELALLWKYYQQGNLGAMRELAKDLKEMYPFLLPAVQAHIERLPSEKSLGRPKEALKEIMDEVGCDDFAPIFRLFCEREAIYGFGDLQVKRLLEEVKKEGR